MTRPRGIRLGDLSFSNQPTAWIGFARTAIYAASIFGADLTDVQQITLVGLVESFLTLFNWSQVTPVNPTIVSAVEPVETEKPKTVVIEEAGKVEP